MFRKLKTSLKLFYYCCLLSLNENTKQKEFTCVDITVAVAEISYSYKIDLWIL